MSGVDFKSMVNFVQKDCGRIMAKMNQKPLMVRGKEHAIFVDIAVGCEHARIKENYQNGLRALTEKKAALEREIMRETECLDCAVSYDLDGSLGGAPSIRITAKLCQMDVKEVV